MTSDARGKFWAVSSSGLVIRWDGATAQHWYLDGLGPTAVWSDGAETWVATYEGVVARLRDGAWSRTEIDRSEHLRAISGGCGDGMWFVTEEGTLAHLDHAGSVTHVAVPSHAAAVWVAAPDDVWVVASAHLPKDLEKWKVLRWNGTTWRDMALPTEPNSGGMGPAITGLGADDVWIVAGPAFHWDGHAWSSPQDGGQTVSMSAHDDAVISRPGQYQIWNGMTWTLHETVTRVAISIGSRRVAADLELHDDDKVTRIPVGSGIEAHHLWVGPDAVYEVGLSLDHRERLAIARWDGIHWSSEELAGTRPSAIAGVDTPWVLDLAGTLWHRDGTSWMSEASGLPRAETLAVASPEDLWVGGSEGKLRHRVRGTWTSVAMDGTSEIDAIAAGAGQLFIARKRDGARELARWTGATFESVVPLPDRATALRVRAEKDVEISLGASRQRWRGAALEPIDVRGDDGQSARGEVFGRDGHVWAMPGLSGDLRVRTTRP